MNKYLQADAAGVLICFHLAGRFRYIYPFYIFQTGRLLADR